jgi:two-component system, chemotaxis family, protein-glutamate methylesterase/glutaminase
MQESPAKAIVIGGSSGALDALGVILPALPRDLLVPLAIVLHVPPSKPNGLVDLFRRATALGVKEAEDKEPLSPGTVYFACPSYHLLVERGRHFSLSVDEPVHFSRPAIDVLFESAADAYGQALAGVLLSGANEDGAHGLACILAAGGTTLVQDPDTALARQMPDSALRDGSPHHVLPPKDIAPYLVHFASQRFAPDSPTTKERG